jgi:endonuclease YncB( thermonuclease family)
VVVRQISFASTMNRPPLNLFQAAFLALLVVLGPSSALAERFDGRRVVIIDGDTFALGSERVRILNIDAPETRGSRCERELVLGLKAKERLAGLLRAGSVDVVRDGQDRYRRTLARVSVGGLDVGQVLVREGLALPWQSGGEAKEARLRHWCG